MKLELNAIIFISKFYAGSISSKSLLGKVLFGQNLWENNDSVIANFIFTVDKDLEPLIV